MTDTRAKGFARLRESFPPNQIGQLPKPTSKDAVKGRCRECGGWHGLPAVHLDYVGHAALTDRLLEVDPEWTWEPMALDQSGAPALDRNGGLWIRLTVLGVTRIGYGDAAGKSGANAVKEAIGDALRNAGMRFGLALDLWHKGDLHEQDQQRDQQPEAVDPVREAKNALWRTVKDAGMDWQQFTAWVAKDAGTDVAQSKDVEWLHGLQRRVQDEGPAILGERAA